tara:strand:+ start:511 stop:1107 length:597 start_codon:yes stop_codon:yes gene_type:complete
MGLLTKGHIISCSDRNRRGGIKAIYLGEVANVTGATAGASGTHNFTSIAGFPSGGALNLVYKFEFDRETAYYTANATRENGSTIVETELGFTVPKITEEIQLRLEELKDSCGLFAIVETFADDGTTTYKFVLGYDTIFSPDAFLEFASGEQNTGTALQDPNETVVKLSGLMAEYPREYVPSGVGLAVETAADNSFSLT